MRESTCCSLACLCLLSSDERRGTGDLEWNYVKFLVGRDGVPVKRFGSLYNPKDFEGDVSD